MPNPFTITQHLTKSLSLAVLILVVFLASCSSEKSQANELLETARFEEKQANLEHAIKLYTEITQKHSTLPAAKEASERLKILKPTIK